MGTAKADLEWHGSTLLRRTTGVLARACDGPVVVVRAPGQPLPALGPDVFVHDDPREGAGPLQGLAVGLAAAAALGADAAFACATDLPFLHVAFVRRVLAALTDDADAVLPVVHGHRQPLAAAYRTLLAQRCTELLAQDRSAPSALLDTCRVTVLDEDALLADGRLLAADPQLDSVLGVNAPEDYRTARDRPAPLVGVQRFGVLAQQGVRGVTQVRAATLGQAADAVGLLLDRYVLAAVNGDQTARAGDTPLVAGDVVSFLSADAGG